MHNGIHATLDEQTVECHTLKSICINSSRYFGKYLDLCILQHHCPMSAMGDILEALSAHASLLKLLRVLRHLLLMNSRKVHQSSRDSWGKVLNLDLKEQHRDYTFRDHLYSLRMSSTFSSISKQAIESFTPENLTEVPSGTQFKGNRDCL